MKQEALKGKAETILNACKEFGAIPKYSWEWNEGLGHFHVCINNGQFHKDPNAKGIPGLADYIGAIRPGYIIDHFDEFLKVSEARGLGLI